MKELKYFSMFSGIGGATMTPKPQAKSIDDYTKKRLEEFDEMFVEYDQRIISEDGSHDIREVAELVETDPDTIKAFIAESIHQAIDQMESAIKLIGGSDES